jgi:2-desacetyl-2-hydroxyethyl bacteriochlorophyllide A dehydrogenase
VTGVASIPDALRLPIERGEIGGRTVQLTEAGEVECVRYEPAALADGHVRIRTVRSAISSGTEMTFYGRGASNVYLHKRWNEDLRLFEPGSASMAYPLVIGYRAAGEVIESRSTQVTVGERIYGSWRHTELTTLPGEVTTAQRLPDGLTWDDGVDIAQMGPICVNAVAYGEGEHAGRPAVVFGAGVVGLLTAQIVRATGADPVHVVDRLPQRLEMAAALGLETVNATETDDVAASLKRRHGAEGIPMAWECTGSSRALHEAIRVVRRRGAVVAVGFYQGDAIGLVLGEEFHHNGVRIVCGQIGNIHPGQTWRTLRATTIGMALDGQLVLGGLPRQSLPVEHAADGFAALQRPGDVLQVALTYDGIAT